MEYTAEDIAALAALAEAEAADAALADAMAEAAGVDPDADTLADAE